ncbi:MAG: hypothetical protein II979_05445 [Clostridia bacterium]|nr:hypothetical protein [Clostridia bacterium]
MNQKSKASMAPAETEEMPVKRKTYNWVVKLLCVFAAVILWLYVMIVVSPQYQEVFYDVAVNLVGVEDLFSKHTLSVYNRNDIGTIDVTVAGKRSQVLGLHIDEIIATADVSTISSSGTVNVNINVEVPSGLTVVEKSKAKVSLDVEEAVTRMIQLSEKVEHLELDEGYERGPAAFSLDSVQVSGPKRIVEGIARAEVALDFTGITTSLERTCEFYFVDELSNRITSRYLRYDNTPVDVYVPIYKTVTVPVEVLFTHGYINESNAAVTVSPGEVTLKGEEAAMRAEELLAPIILDEKKITENSYGKTVTLQPAEGITIQDGITSVQVHVDIDDSIQYLPLTITDIEVTGASGIRYEIEDKELQVVLRGPLDQLSGIRSSDVYALVDLSGYSSDSSAKVTKTPTIVIDAEDAADVYEVGEYAVQVQIN